MAQRVPIAQARDRLTRLIRRVEGGESVELTRRGRPVAALVSIPEYRRLRNGAASFWSALQEFRGQLSERDLRDLHGALEDLRDRGRGREVPL